MEHEVVLDGFNDACDVRDCLLSGARTVMIVETVAMGNALRRGIKILRGNIVLNENENYSLFPQ